MKTIPQRLCKLGWNRRVLTYADFEQACEDDQITVITKHLPDDLGQYRIEQSREVITLDRALHDPLRVFVAFHEFGHALYHVPGHYGLHAKTELEADVIAVVALLPRPLLYKLSPGEISEALGYPLSLIDERYSILRNLQL